MEYLKNVLLKLVRAFFYGILGILIGSIVGFWIGGILYFVLIPWLGVSYDANYNMTKVCMIIGQCIGLIAGIVVGFFQEVF